MSLQLFEVVPSNATREGAESVIAAIASAAEQNGAQVLESQVTEGQGRVFTVVELNGDDTTALDQAIRNGVERAARTLRHVDWFEMTQVRGHVKDGQVEHFQVGLKVGFRLEDD